MNSFFKKFFHIFAPFKFKNYRYLWTGAFLSNIGSWVQSLALNWYIVNKYNSSLYLGTVNFITSLPTVLFSPIAGVIADRHDKKNIIIHTHLLMCLNAILLGLIIKFVTTDNVIYWIFVISFIFGLGNTFTSPSWQAIIPQLVDKESLLQSIALNSAQFNLARFVGPVIATFIISWLGLVWCFYFNGISFLSVVLSLLFIKLKIGPTNYNLNSNWKEDVVEVWKYIRTNKMLAKYLLSAGIISFFGMGYVVLLPIYAKNILSGNVKTLGTLMSSSGIGAFTGALIVSLINLYVSKHYIIKYGFLLYASFISIFALSKNLLLSSISIFFAALTYISVISSINTTIQENTSEHYRGRVMSNFVWLFMGMMPFGAVLCGWLSEIISPQFTLIFFNLCLVLWSLTVI